MIAAGHEPNQVRNDQPDETDDADRRYRDRGGQRGHFEHEQPKAIHRQTDDRLLPYRYGLLAVPRPGDPGPLDQ